MKADRDSREEETPHAGSSSGSEAAPGPAASAPAPAEVPYPQRERRKKPRISPTPPAPPPPPRFDRLKDPVGVVQAYKLAKKYVDFQLVLAGGGAADDPEGAAVLQEV
ncbi:MAG TPA: hypothetical protein VE825_01325, partial [Terriglobales bacterium]|nr:hypothetical protein [Terriglobales bacterium]